MSVSAEVETRYRTNVLTVPIASVTTRLPKEAKKDGAKKSGNANAIAGKDDSSATNATSRSATNSSSSEKKSKEAPKPIEVVFVTESDHVKMVPVKIGISDADYWEITEGLTDQNEVVAGGYKAVNRELEDGKKFRRGKPEKSDEEKDKETK
jgi:HlyD family secretion protein